MVCCCFILISITNFSIHFREVYHFDLGKKGVFAATPYILLAIGMLSLGQLYDRILAKIVM